MPVWVFYNPSPVGRSVGDCSVRAIAKALNTDWETAYVQQIHINARHSPRQHGFYKRVIGDSCPECYTAEMFCRDNPKGIYVLGFGGHVATVVDGKLYDSWDSSQEIPAYVWYLKD